MASLLGKADPTLVTAAARAGLANVPGDYSKQFGIMADASKDIFTGIEEAFKKYETGLKADKLKLDTAISELQKYGAGIENDADSKKFQGEMDDQYNIYKENGGFKNDRRGFNEWERQNNKIMSKYESNKTSMIEAIEAYQSDDSWIAGLNKSDVGFFNGLVAYGKNLGDKAGIHNEKADNYMANNTGASTDKKPEDLWKHLGAKDGEMVKYLDPVTNEFTYITSVDGKVISKKSSDIQKMIPQKAIKTETAIHTEINKKIKNSTGVYSDYDSQKTQNWLESLIDDAIEAGNPHALQFLMDQKYGGMEMSFVEALKSGKAVISPAIIKSLEGVGGFKSDGDEFLDRGDFATGTAGQANYEAMVQSILYGDDTYELRKNLFVDTVDIEGFRPGIEQKAQEGKFNTLKAFLGHKKNLPTVYNSWAPPRTFHGAAKQIQKRLDGEEENVWFGSVLSGNRYKLKDGQWYVQKPDDSGNGWSKKQRMSLEEVKDDLSLTDYDNILFPGQTEQGSVEAIDAETDKQINVTPKLGPSGQVEKVPKPTKPVAETVSGSGLENITEDTIGGGSGLFRYYNYTGNDYKAAAEALTAAKEAGIDNAFIKILKDNKQIGTEEYMGLKDRSGVTFKVQLGVGKKSIVGEGAETPSVAVPPDTTGVPSDSTIVTQPDTSVVETPIDTAITTPADTSTVETPPVAESDLTTEITDEMLNENYTGQGTYTYGGGSKYVGEFIDGELYGQGTYTFTNGEKYVGKFKDGEYHGKGVWTIGGEESDPSWYWEGDELDGGAKEFLERQKASETEEEDQTYGPNNPDPMTGTINTSGDEILNESGKYISLNSKEGKRLAKMSPKLKKGETPIIANTSDNVSEKVVEENPVLNENVENPNGNTNPLEYIVDNGYLNAKEADADNPLVVKIDGIYDTLLGRADTSLARLPLTHDDKAWCGAFVYEVLTGTGAVETKDIRVQSEDAYNKLRAAQYLNIGDEVKGEPKMGDVIVVSRMVKGKKKFHVAFYAGKNKNGKVIMLGGNQDNQVSFKTVTDSYTIEGYRRMENMSDIKEATAADYKAEYGVKV